MCAECLKCLERSFHMQDIITLQVIYIYIQQAMLDLPTNTFNAYKIQGSLLAIMDLEKYYIMSSVKLKNQLKIYFKQAFDLFLDLPQALTTNVSY